MDVILFSKLSNNRLSLFAGQTSINIMQAYDLSAGPHVRRPKKHKINPIKVLTGGSCTKGAEYNTRHGPGESE